MTPPDVLVDTSVAVPLLIDGHDHHQRLRRALSGRKLGLAGHAEFETYSVLTRLPRPDRRNPDVVATLIAADFPVNRYLSAVVAAELLTRLVGAGIAGGSVSDALIGAVAAEHELPLATRDRRALATYRALGVDVEFLG